MQRSNPGVANERRCALAEDHDRVIETRKGAKCIEVRRREELSDGGPVQPPQIGGRIRAQTRFDFVIDRLCARPRLPQHVERRRADRRCKLLNECEWRRTLLIASSCRDAHQPAVGAALPHNHPIVDVERAVSHSGEL